MTIDTDKTDKVGYNQHYKSNISALSELRSASDYQTIYESTRIGPYYKSGSTKGYVRWASVKRLVDDARAHGKPFEEITVLDAGSGQGELSVYLACLGFSVIGVDISDEAKKCSEFLARNVGVSDRCRFFAESLESTSIPDKSIDYIIGHASLHHFIKYDGVPAEFNRIMKAGAKGYFADSFGENKLYHLFHNKDKMRRLGDVTLTKSLVEKYFDAFKVELTPTDWFVMLDKLYLKVLPNAAVPVVKKISSVHHWIDRRISPSSRVALYLSGAILTEIEKY